MTDQFGDGYKIIAERPQNKVDAYFALFLRSIKSLIRETKRKIPESNTHLLNYANFIENKIFYGIPESNIFKFSSKNEIKILIEGSGLSKEKAKMYESAMKLSVLESKNIELFEKDVNLSDTLDSINSLDNILSNRLRRINSSRLSNDSDFINVKMNQKNDVELIYIVSEKNIKNLPNINTIKYQNESSDNQWAGYDYVKN